jgi:hypothetical protein
VWRVETLAIKGIGEGCRVGAVVWRLEKGCRVGAGCGDWRKGVGWEQGVESGDTGQ